MVMVDGKGENSIVVAPGANGMLKPGDVDRAAGVIEGAAAVVIQLEIPMQTVRYALRVARSMGVYTILDPAPVPGDGLAAEMMRVDLLCPNQGEAELLLGRRRTHHVRAKKVVDPKWIGGELLTMGAKRVVMKLGSKGAIMVGADGEMRRFKAHKIAVTDTTAAGDAFCGALAVGKAEGMREEEMVRLANAAGAVCCTGFGAQPALPSRGEVERLLLGE